MYYRMSRSRNIYRVIEEEVKLSAKAKDLFFSIKDKGIHAVFSAEQIVELKYGDPIKELVSAGLLTLIENTGMYCKFQITYVEEN